MRSPAAKCLIIGVLALALSACSLVRIAYDNGPLLASRWIDGWLDLDSAQHEQLRPALQRWFDWHRAAQLPGYAQALARWRRQAQGDPSAQAICAEADAVRASLTLAVEHALPEAAALLPALTAAQLAHLEREQAERLAKWRQDYLPARPQERLQAGVARAIERAEDFYGPLQPAQRALLADAQQRSPLDAEAWAARRQARNRLLLDGLRQARALDSQAARLKALTELAQRFQAPPDAAYAQMLARWQAHSCETAAGLHRLATPEQRQHLDRRLQGWQEDLQALAARGAG